MNTQELQEKLTGIFKHYKEKYGFEDMLILTDNRWILAKVNHSNRKLYLNIDKLNMYYQLPDQDIANAIIQRLNLTNHNIDIFVIGVLLHEIGHIVDRTENTTKFWNELERTDSFLYRNNREYHHTRSFEVRADNFAKQELKKWV